MQRNFYNYYIIFFILLSETWHSALYSFKYFTWTIPEKNEARAFNSTFDTEKLNFPLSAFEIRHSCTTLAVPTVVYNIHAQLLNTSNISSANAPSRSSRRRYQLRALAASAVASGGARFCTVSLWCVTSVLFWFASQSDENVNSMSANR